MIILADSGSTRTEWCLLRPGFNPLMLETLGFNPYFTSPGQMEDEIAKELAPFFYPEKIEQLFFYGAGTGLEINRDKLHEVLRFAFPRAEVNVFSDMLGAARSLWGQQPGIACILGTGSNACLFDGRDISFQTPSLGYVLGDEGGGVHLGKILLRAVLRDELPKDLQEAFSETYRKEKLALLEGIYRQERPNAFIASFAPFLKDNIQHPIVLEMVEASFNSFLDRIIGTIPLYEGYALGFTGSVAYSFKDVLVRVVEKAGLKTGKVTRSPMDGLITFHSS